MLIALGVTGGIGAYKAVEVARGLQKRGHDVVAVMTHSATRFVGAITFEAITRRRVIASKVTGPTKRVAECVITATTSWPRFCSPRATSTALYAPIPPVTPRAISDMCSWEMGKLGNW